MKKLILIILLTPQAEAGWIGKTCSRLFSGLSAPDPYQYETYQLDDLVMTYEAIGIRGAWGRLSPDDAETLNIIGGELRWRLQTGLSLGSGNVQRVEQALDLYSQHEGHAPYAKGRTQ